MSPNLLARAIDELINSADARYIRNVNTVNKDLYNQLSTILKELEVDGDGFIKQNSENRKILSKAETKVSETFRSSLYVSAAQNYVNTIPKIDLQNVNYFTSIDDTFKPNRIFLKNLQADAIAQVESAILKDGLKSQVIQPLSRILTTNINTGGQFSGFLEQVRTYVLGNADVDPRALRYSRTYLRDILFQYSRAYQESVTNDLKLDWYLYQGGLIDTSRPFCIARAGKYFHRSEIESWASLEWSGKISGTTESSIFIYAGGHSCGHSIIPVSTLVVPQEDLSRIE